MTINEAINQLKTFEPKHIGQDIEFYEKDYEAIHFAVLAMELLKEIYEGAYGERS